MTDQQSLQWDADRVMEQIIMQKVGICRWVLWYLFNLVIQT